MKVLEKGNGAKSWSTVANCTGAGNRGGGCGAKLQVEATDLFRTTSNARDETTEYTTFKCPECQVLTDLPEGKVPSDIERKLVTRNPR